MPAHKVLFTTVLLGAVLLAALVSAACTQDLMRPIGGRGFNPFTGLPVAELSMWTYEGCNVFPNPVNGTMRSVADQLELQTMSSAHSDNTMLLLSNMSDYSKSHQSWDSFSINAIIAGFSHTAEAAKVEEIFKAGRYNVITYDLDMSAYTFYYDYAGAYAQEKSNLRMAVDRLPGTCSSAEDRWFYRQFLHDFGPSVMSTGTAGTTVRFYSVFDTDLLRSHNSSWVFHQTSMWVALKCLDLGLSFNSNSTTISVDVEFLEKAFLTWSWRGGNATDYASNRTRYLEHSYHHPVVTGVVPVPVYEAVPSSLPQRACLEQLVPEWVAHNGSLPVDGADHAAASQREPAPVRKPRMSLTTSGKPRGGDSCSASTSCLPLIPGAFMFQRGYNVVQQRSSVEPLFEFAWGDYEPVASSPYHPEWTYAIPNELWMDHEQWAFNDTLFQTSQDAKSYYDEIVHVSKSGGFFYSKSRTTIDIISRHLSHNSSFGMRSISQHLYRMGIDLTALQPNGGPRTPRFSADFVNDVLAMPKAYVGHDAPKWEAFMDRWGTDYVADAMFGGFIEMVTWFDACFYEKYNGHFVEEQSGFDFIIARHEKGWKTAQEQLNAEWEQYRRVSTRLMGGNAGDFEPSQWNEWAQSLYRFPVAYAVRPVSLELLINLVSSEHRQAFTDARVGYMATQFSALEKQAKENAVPQPYTPPSWCSWHK